MDSYQEMETFMRASANQQALDHFMAWLTYEQNEDREPNLLERLANLPLSHQPASSALDRALGILRAEYDEQRGSYWARELRPWQCRLLGVAVGSAFTQAFGTKLHIPFDGCYWHMGDVGRAEEFIATFASYATRVADGQPFRGRLAPDNIKELVLYQDPLFTGTGQNMPRRQVRTKSAWHLHRRFEEDKDGGKLLMLTPKRRRLYEKVCLEAQEAEVEDMFHYDHNKVALIWIGLINILRFLPNVEVFRWHSDAVMVEAFLRALSYYCSKIKILDLRLNHPFGTNEHVLQIWNRFYQDEPGGRLYQSSSILNKAVAGCRCAYLINAPENRPWGLFPEQCRINIRLNLKRDVDVDAACETIARYCQHVQSLVIDRSKSLPGKGIKERREHEVVPQSLKPVLVPRLGASHLSLISTSAALNSFTMSFLKCDSIESLEIKDCQALQYIYMPLVRGTSSLRKFKITFPPSIEAKERAYNYWKHHVLQMRFTFDFLRAGAFALDELEIHGDFGEPSQHPVHFSGLTPDLFFAIEEHTDSLVRLHVVNTDIDFSLEEIGQIICLAKNLTQLAITCRAFLYETMNGDWVEQGLGTGVNFEKILRLLTGRTTPFSLTLLRTHYHPLDEQVYDRDAADRRIVTSTHLAQLTNTAKQLVLEGVPLAHLGIYAESMPNMYGIFGTVKNWFANKLEMTELQLEEDVHGVWHTYAEFERVNREWITRLGVPQPRGVGRPPRRVAVA